MNDQITREANFAPDLIDLIDRMAQDQETKKQIDEVMALVDCAGSNRREDYVFLARLREVPYDQIAATLAISPSAARAYCSQATTKIMAVVQVDLSASMAKLAATEEIYSHGKGCNRGWKCSRSSQPSTIRSTGADSAIRDGVDEPGPTSKRPTAT